jgi:acid phosphatase (class A)
MIKSRLPFLPLALLAFCAAPLLRAAEAAKYLSAGQPDPIALLAPPPVPGSAEDATDMESAFRVYSAATPAERARGTDEVKLTIFHFAPAIGPWFVPGKFPKTEALFKEVEAEANVVKNLAKNHWQRIRPYHGDPARFPDAIEHEARTDYSYPSGHSTRGTTYALLLAELFPDKRDALLAKGRDTGWLRVQGGVHYPADIYAGRVLGQALAREFLASPAFQRDLAAARAELAAAGK